MHKANFLKSIKFKVLLSGFLGVIFFSCHSKPNQAESKDVDGATKIRVEVKLLEFEDGWGYQVLEGDHVYINQPYIPAISGYHRFQTKDEALKTGQYLLQKLEQGKGLRISPEEIDSLKITY